MLDIEKYAFTVIGIKSLIFLGIISLIPIFFSCYYQAFTFKLELVGINFLLENESITISIIVLSNSHSAIAAPDAAATSVTVKYTKSLFLAARVFIAHY